MVKWIAEAHGGSVAAESTEGVGSTFSIMIPKGENDPEKMRDFNVSLIFLIYSGINERKQTKNK